MFLNFYIFIFQLPRWRERVARVSIAPNSLPN